jgi:septal ring factor EnvC (AmiA/AmiB activator)
MNQPANATPVILIDDLIESEKSRMRDKIAALEAKVCTQSENLACYAQSLKHSESIRSRLHGELLTMGYENDNLQASLQAMDDMLDQAAADQALVSGLKRGIKYTAILALVIVALVGLAQCEWQPSGACTGWVCIVEEISQ